MPNCIIKLSIVRGTTSIDRPSNSRDLQLSSVEYVIVTGLRFLPLVLRLQLEAELPTVGRFKSVSACLLHITRQLRLNNANVRCSWGIGRPKADPALARAAGPAERPAVHRWEGVGH
jgi:hypothetical protein